MLTCGTFETGNEKGNRQFHYVYRVCVVPWCALSDWSSFNVHDFLFWKSSRAVRRRSILSAGSRVSIRMLSRIMPINSKTLCGPSVLPGAMGMLRFLSVSNIAFKLIWHAPFFWGPGDAGSIIRKSSSMWHTNEIKQLLLKIHSIASDNWLKMNGALRRPNGNTLS